MQQAENPLNAYIEPGSIESPQQLDMAEAMKKAFLESVIPIDEVGDYLPEEDDPNVLIYGPWLERGGSAFWISTAGTGKSIASIQLAHAMSAGLPFCGLKPRGRLKFWIFQSEDSPRRVAQDRIDVRAELKEQYPDVDWDKTGPNVRVVRLTGKVGPAFVESLDALLREASLYGERPDVIVLNPFLAFVGGPVSDGAYVTPFLRGGTVDGLQTEGLQAVLERHAVGALIFHHTPKPPKDSDLDAWMKSQFPEYQGAGSADITNWGRSFVTMMKVKDHPRMVCVTAGKNGGELGWQRIGGAFRHYLAYSDETGVSGKGRHAWRNLTQEELDDVTGNALKSDEELTEKAAASIAEAIKAAPVAPLAGLNELNSLVDLPGISREIIRRAANRIVANPDQFHLEVKPVLHANTNNFRKHVGQTENLRAAAEAEEQKRRYLNSMKGGKNAVGK